MLFNAGTKGGIAITQGPSISFIAPQGQLVAPMLAKFGMEEWTEACQFSQNRCLGGGVSPQKLTILRNFEI